MTFLHSHKLLCLRLLVTKLTTCVTSQALKYEGLFFIYMVFSLIEPMLIPHLWGQVM